MQARAELDAAQAEYDRLLADYEKTFDESFRRHYELQAIASSVYRSLDTLVTLIRLKSC
jgi:hypothetical protein